MNRLDSEVVARGLARSRNRAASLIHDGRITVNGVTAHKPSFKVNAVDDVKVVGSSDQQDYASRASFKLLRTLEAIARETAPSHEHADSRPLWALEGSKALDVGASTGGFTDVLLRHGAQHVVALDVGHDQLVDELRRDTRVSVVEGYNARELRPEDLPYTPDLVVCDVSFISITLILPALSSIVDGKTNLLLMVKPQFEVGKHNLGHGGVVRNKQGHSDALVRVLTAAQQCGFQPQAIIPSALPGPNGNREFFVWLTLDALRQPTRLGGSDALMSTEEQELAPEVVAVVQRAVDNTPDLPVEGDMIEERGNALLGKGIPAPANVPATSVYWV